MITGGAVSELTISGFGIAQEIAFAALYSEPCAGVWAGQSGNCAAMTEVQGACAAWSDVFGACAAMTEVQGNCAAWTTLSEDDL